LDSAIPSNLNIEPILGVKLTLESQGDLARASISDCFQVIAWVTDRACCI
jgi:hypothetical protein